MAVLGEALSNVARHSGATRVDVHLTAADDIMLVVCDDGGGVPAYTPHVGGLANMRERAQRHGGEFTVSVRDDGRGFAPDRLAAARAEGRLGVASSIEGRVRDLGGTMAVESVPGEGTTVRWRVPAGWR